MKKLAITIIAVLALTLTGCVDNRKSKSESGVSRNLSSERIIRFGHNYMYFYDNAPCLLSKDTIGFRYSHKLTDKLNGE